jgi:voltage-gated potassium channel
MEFSEYILICGFGMLGASTGRELRRRNVRPGNVSVIEVEHGRFEEARKFGFRSILGDAADANRLRVACVGVATRIMVCVTDEAAAAVTKAARGLAPSATIVAALRTVEQREAVLSAGANEVIVLSRMTGEMLADSIAG